MKMRNQRRRQSLKSVITGPFRSVEALIWALRMRGVL